MDLDPLRGGSGGDSAIEDMVQMHHPLRRGDVGGGVEFEDVPQNLQEPMGLHPALLDAHELKVALEPGPPALDHCFPEDQAERWEVDRISDYQLHHVFVDGGGREPFVEQMYKVHWKAWNHDRTGNDWTWVPASNLDAAREALDIYQRQQGVSSHMETLRAQFPGCVLDYDYSPDSSQRPEALERALIDVLQPLAADELESATPLFGPATSSIDKTNVVEGKRGGRLSALHASVSSVRVPPTSSGGIGVNGEVFVPRMDPLAEKKYKLAAELEGPAMSEKSLEVLADRIRLLALAAQVHREPDSVKDNEWPRSEPSSFRDAMESAHAPKWIQAMDAELQSMEDFGVWKLVPRPPGANVVGCKWIFTIKKDVVGEVLKLKARLTARGFTQREGRDFKATWAPTCRMRVFRMMMAEASSDPEVMTAQWDLSTAFLHAKIDHTVYMEQPELPEGHSLDEESTANHVCLLLKSIYGLKQSSRLFHELVRDSLLEMGAVQAEADECLFIIKEDGKWMRILVHVDDFACTFNDRALYDRIYAAMQARFVITDYGGGDITRFVGVCVEKTSEGHYRLHQKPYIEQVLERLNLADIKHASSPERAGTEARLTPYEGELGAAEREFMTSVPYKEAVSALFYLSRSTRFDIAHAVGQVARFMDRPCHRHWKAVLRIYAYLARTKNVALVMSSRGMECELADQFLEGFSDSDWAGCKETRKSHTGWLVRVGGSLVAWYSKRQSSISQSTAEAEYVSAAAVANEIVWWRRLCNDMGYDFDGPVTLWCDNRAATTLADHAGRFDAAKHIQMRYHVLRDYQKRGIVKVRWRKSKKMWADILTKNCQSGHFRAIVSELMREDV